MSTFIEASGWGIFPVLLFGIVLNAAALLYAGSTRPRHLPLFGILAVATFTSGILGAVIGASSSARWAARELDYGSLLVDTADSANILIAACVFIILACLIACVGAARYAVQSQPPGQ